MKEQYGYIICGSGLAGLSLAYRLIQSGFDKEQILLIDKDTKKKNDRTWCFWEKEENLFEEIVYKRWTELDFYSPSGKIDLNISPYQYKMIRGIDFYRHCLKTIESAPNAKFINESILGINSVKNGAIVKTSGGEYQSKIVFNSALRESFVKTDFNYVDQHFKGWVIKTKSDEFDPARATFMDFRIDQEGEARFFYVLPTSSDVALVEVAIFSNEILDQDHYDRIIRNYIDDFLKIREYEILEKEFGVIPMTNYRFKREMGRNIINIGTSGGAVKPSSGYAFKRIQEQCDDIIKKLRADEYPLPFKRKWKYEFLDGILLNVVQTNKCSSAEVFHRLFKKYKASLVLKFLDEKSNILDDLRIVSAPPVWPFTKAAFEEIF